MEYLSSYIKPELLVLVPVLYLTGCAVKNSQTIADKYIPLILGLAGVALSVAYVLAGAGLTGWRDGLMALFTSVTQGILCAGASVYVNQMIKQSQKGE